MPNVLQPAPVPQNSPLVSVRDPSGNEHQIAYIDATTLVRDANWTWSDRNVALATAKQAATDDAVRHGLRRHYDPATERWQADKALAYEENDERRARGVVARAKP